MATCVPSSAPASSAVVDGARSYASACTSGRSSGTSTSSITSTRRWACGGTPLHVSGGDVLEIGNEPPSSKASLRSWIVRGTAEKRTSSATRYSGPARQWRMRRPNRRIIARSRRLVDDELERQEHAGLAGQCRGGAGRGVHLHV